MDNIQAVSYYNLPDIIGRIKAVYSPTLFLLHPKMVNNIQLIDLMTSNESGGDKTDYLIPKSTLWNSSLAIELLTSKFILQGGTSRNTPKQMYKKIESLIDIQNNEILNSLSALCSHLEKFIFTLDRGEITISSLTQSRYFDKFMKIDSYSYESLQIFSKDKHPNGLKVRLNTI